MHVPGAPAFQQTSPADKPWIARINFVLLFFKDNLFLMGGLLSDGSYANDIWSTPYVYGDVNPWNDNGVASWSGREGHQGVVHTVEDVEYVFIMGGQGTGQTFLHDVYKWTADGSAKWELVTAAPAWKPRWAFGYVASGVRGAWCVVHAV